MVESALTYSGARHKNHSDANITAVPGTGPRQEGVTE
jgi:hypothetical protein